MEGQQQTITLRLFLTPNFMALNSFKLGNMYKQFLVGKLEKFGHNYAQFHVCLENVIGRVKQMKYPAH